LSAPVGASDWIETHLPWAASAYSTKEASGTADVPWLVDWACGQGRHSALALARGWRVIALDRDPEALSSLERVARQAQTAAKLRVVNEDLEAPHGAAYWQQRLRLAVEARPETSPGFTVEAMQEISPGCTVEARLETSPGFTAEAMRHEGGAPGIGAILITRYLHRASWAMLASLLAPGGWLLHETFAQGHARYGRPSRAAFLLQPGELLALAQRANLAILAYQDGTLEDVRGEPFARVQRIVARKPLRETWVDPGAGFRLRAVG
jgi:hypothetical protein